MYGTLKILTRFAAWAFFFFFRNALQLHYHKEHELGGINTGTYFGWKKIRSFSD